MRSKVLTALLVAGVLLILLPLFCEKATKKNPVDALLEKRVAERADTPDTEDDWEDEGSSDEDHGGGYDDDLDISLDDDSDPQKDDDSDEPYDDDIPRPIESEVNDMGVPPYDSPKPRKGNTSNGNHGIDRDNKPVSERNREVKIPARVKLRAMIKVSASSLKDSIVKFQSILEGIKDKDTADAAAPLLATAIKRIGDDESRLIGLASPNRTDDSSKMVQEASKDIFILAAETWECLDALEKASPAYYGSERLEKTLSQLKVKGVIVAPVKKEQKQADIMCVDAAVASWQELKSELVTVKDKESADAAVPNVDKNMSDLLESAAVLNSLGRRPGMPRGYYLFLFSHYFERMQVMDEVLQRVQELNSMDPPCYGSNALHDAINKKQKD